MYYLLTLPQSPMPNEFHVWEQNELDTCCGDVKIIYKNESAEACYQFAKEESWKDFYHNGFYSKILPSIKEKDMKLIKKAFEDGFEASYIEASFEGYKKYSHDDRKFGKGKNGFGDKDYVLLVNCYVAGMNYRNEGISA